MESALLYIFVAGIAGIAILFLLSEVRDRRAKRWQRRRLRRENGVYLWIGDDGVEHRADAPPTHLGRFRDDGSYDPTSSGGGDGGSDGGDGGGNGD